MGFLRIKTRSSSRGTVTYGYIVVNSWNYNKGYPQQKVLGYAGRVYSLLPATVVPLTDFSFSGLVVRELLRHGFVFDGDVWKLREFCVDLSEKNVYSLSTGKPLVLQLHAGFLCSYSLEKLFSLSLDNAKLFAQQLQLCGLSVTPEEFVTLWEKLSAKA